MNLHAFAVAAASCVVTQSASAQVLRVQTIETRPNGDERTITLAYSSATEEFRRVAPRRDPINAENINDFAVGYRSSDRFYLLLDDPTRTAGIYRGWTDEIRQPFLTGGLFETADQVSGITFNRGLNSLIREGDIWRFYKFRTNGTMRRERLDLTGPASFIASTVWRGDLFALDSINDALYRVDRSNGATTMVTQFDFDVQEGGAGMGGYTVGNLLNMHALVDGQRLFWTYNITTAATSVLTVIDRDIDGLYVNPIPAPGTAAALLGFGAFATRRRRGR
ncbi:MAG: hypothetical protein ACTS27_05695 [Phycisphaerales bacterium]